MNERVASKARSAAREFTLASFLWRFLASLALVMATFNPSGYSFVDWVRQHSSAGSLGPEHLVVGLVLLIGWTILLVATRRSLETLGTVLGVALLAALVWLLIDFGWLRLDSMDMIEWVVLVCLALLLAIGLSWSHIWRRLTGQLEVDSDS